MSKLLVVLAAGVGAGAAWFLRSRHELGEKRKHKADLKTWEGEGGNVPEVQPVSPVVTPESSVPASRH